MSFLERTFYLELFLPLPMEGGCQDTIYNADSEGLQRLVYCPLSDKVMRCFAYSQRSP